MLAYCEALADAAGLRDHLVLHTRVLRVDPMLPDSVHGSLPNVTQQSQTPPVQKAATGSTESTVHPPVSTEQHDDCTGQCSQPSQFAQPLHQHTGLRWHVVTETQHSSSTAATAAGAASGDAAADCQEAAAVAGQPASQQQEWVFDAVSSCVGIFSEIQLPQVRSRYFDDKHMHISTPQAIQQAVAMHVGFSHAYVCGHIC